MPTYEFRCRECAQTFEVKRPMSAASDPATCPHGHADTVKLLSLVSLGRTGSDGAAAPVASGGCCGGSCGCGVG